MAIEIKLPHIGESVVEGTITKWLKRPGETVKKYEPLFEVMTDKVDVEVPSPASGFLTEILIPEGQTVRVGTVVAMMQAEEAPEAALAAPETAKTFQGEAGAAVEEVKSPTETLKPLGTVERISPVVAKLAAQYGIDLRQIKGTGLGGRVTKQDVLKYLETRGAKEAVTPAREAAAVEVVPPLEEGIALTPIRKAIAEHMVRSKRTAPHVTTVMEVDMSRVVAFREKHKDEFQKREGFPLTYLPFFIQAAVAALRAFPIVNATFTEEKIVLKKRIHIGIAVATDEGLIVPVIKDADEKSLLRLAREAYDLATKAREGRLSPDDVAGGTFTITNHGAFGSLLGTPIIHQPQVAILGTGAVTKRVVVVDDAIAIRPMVYLSLSFDHRAFDGAVADRFLARIKEHLEAGGFSL